MTLLPNEIKRLSELDFSKFDHDKVSEAVNANDGINKTTKITENIPEEFKIDFNLSTDMELKTVSQAEQLSLYFHS
ncbi:hypothetical protein [Succinimonas sp.]|uniref:hypothetical protein n=1 Tax=Succinimonas sp. TaxID=1936151 RepID=UPI0038645291